MTTSRRRSKFVDCKSFKTLESVGGLQSQIDFLNRFINLHLNEKLRIKENKLDISNGLIMYGPSGTGKTLLLQVISDQFSPKMNFIFSDGSSFVGEKVKDIAFKLNDIFEQAFLLYPCLIIFDNIDIISSGKKAASDQEKKFCSTLANFFDKMKPDKRIPVIGVANSLDLVNSSLLRSGRFEEKLEFSIPLPKERIEILNKLMSKINHQISNDVFTSLAESAHSFTGSDLAHVFRRSSMNALERGSSQVTEDDLRKAFQSIKPTVMREITLEVPKVYWTDIGGMRQVKDKLLQAVIWPFKNPEAFQRLGIQPPKGVLMYGPPGCSKTMIGKALATESGLNFISIKGPELFNKYVGESERAVREIFRKAKQAAPAILFFDELDALATERGGGNGSSCSVGDRVLAQLLTEMDGIESLDGVTIVAASNRPDKIDMALLRPGRFDSIIYVPLPDFETRKEILQIKLKKMSVSDSVLNGIDDLAKSTQSYSGAEIGAICQEAALLALADNVNAERVSLDNFEKALVNVKPRISQELVGFYDSYHKMTEDKKLNSNLLNK